jgi:hypothetical protein
MNVQDSKVTDETNIRQPVVTETIDNIGRGSSKTLVRTLGVITIVCPVLHAVPPTSILGAILLTGYLGDAMASYLPIFLH